MFVWAEIPDGFDSSEGFVSELFQKTGVLVTPGSAFGPSGENHVRLALVQDEQVLSEAVRLMGRCGLFRH
jgi:LL-diaminopimelate aminotransferase